MSLPGHDKRAVRSWKQRPKRWVLRRLRKMASDMTCCGRPFQTRSGDRKCLVIDGWQPRIYDGQQRRWRSFVRIFLTSLWLCDSMTCTIIVNIKRTLVPAVPMWSRIIHGLGRPAGWDGLGWVEILQFSMSWVALSRMWQKYYIFDDYTTYNFSPVVNYAY